MDALSDRWASLRPRARVLVSLAGVLALTLTLAARVARAELRWGGEPVEVLVAAEDLPVGATRLAVRTVAFPPAAVPPQAVDELPAGAALALALPRGAVLTRAHLDPRGPGAGLAPGSRAVPVAVEQSWGVTAGGRVDVWVLAAGPQPATLVARSAVVLSVSGDGDAATALLGLAEDDVGPTTEGLALGRVLLTHAPS